MALATVTFASALPNETLGCSTAAARSTAKPGLVSASFGHSDTHPGSQALNLAIMIGAARTAGTLTDGHSQVAEAAHSVSLDRSTYGTGAALGCSLLLNDPPA